jgi:hypothetical protein
MIKMPTIQFKNIEREKKEGGGGYLVTILKSISKTKISIGVSWDQILIIFIILGN